MNLFRRAVFPALRNNYSSRTKAPEPLRLSGALKGYKHVELTPVLGTEFLEGSLAEMLNAPNSDELIREFAITGKSSESFAPV